MKNLPRVAFVFFFTISVFLVHAQNIVWREVASGVWKGVVGKPEDYDLLKASGASPMTNALAKMGKVSFPLPQADITGKLQDGKTYLRIPLVKEEQLFGFGLN